MKKDCIIRYGLVIGFLCFLLVSCPEQFPDISGDWLLIEICLLDNAYLPVPCHIDQEGPDITASIAGYAELEGTIDYDGNIEVSGSINDITLKLTGAYDGADQVSLSGILPTGEECLAILKRT